ncbi:MAG: class I SAM-dependent methyltransferase [Proteobacteria bacterium]|nr:class I SAM-dependent methyltransferase [Pseudomonadota bacterium]
MSETIKSYADIVFHRKIGELIKKLSENKEDIRDIAKHEIKWNKTRTMLDLGCGYGWFEEVLEDGLDLVFGIDCLNENKAGFLRASKRIAKEVMFEKMQLPLPIEMPSDSFDLIVSAYSLYFFPGVMPEVKRLLCPEGIFLVITHSESMLKEGEDFFDFRNLREVIRHFSAENGETILKRYFSRVTSIDYPNALLFTKNDSGHLAQYIDFKKEFISKDVNPEVVREKMLEELKKKGIVKLNKDDRIFIARK